MLCLLFLLFTVLPVLELYLLLKIGQAIDWPATLALVLTTGAIGAALARWQGTVVLRQLHERTGRGEMPGRELFDGALILLAGAVLITPGVVTDVIGFSLLLPPVRSVLAKVLQRYAKARIQVSLGAGGLPPGFGAQLGGGAPGGPFPGGPFPGPTPGNVHPGGPDGDVIDVTPKHSGPAMPTAIEVIDVTPNDPPKGESSA